MLKRAVSGQNQCLWIVVPMSGFYLPSSHDGSRNSKRMKMLLLHTFSNPECLYQEEEDDDDEKEEDEYENDEDDDDEDLF